MLLYISSNENINIFDFLSNEKGMVIKKLSGSFSLKQFVINDMRSFNHYRYLAIDLKALKDIDDEIIEAIIAFKSMYSSRVVFYADEVKSHENLIIRLVEAGVYNIVFDADVATLKEDIVKAVTGEGLSKRDIQRKYKSVYNHVDEFIPEYSFLQENVKIAVTGTFSRVGTTTLAINLCQFLAEIGARVCYVEANKNGHMSQLVDGSFYKGVRYLSLSSESDEDFDFTIYDMGVLDMRIKHAMKSKCDEAVLCSTCKPYELKVLQKAVKFLGDDKYRIVMSLTEDKNISGLNDMEQKVFFSNYTPNPHNAGINEVMWERIIDKYISKQIN